MYLLKATILNSLVDSKREAIKCYRAALLTIKAAEKFDGNPVTKLVDNIESEAAVCIKQYGETVGELDIENLSDMEEEAEEFTPESNMTATFKHQNNVAMLLNPMSLVSPPTMMNLNMYKGKIAKLQ